MCVCVCVPPHPSGSILEETIEKALCISCVPPPCAKPTKTRSFFKSKVTMSARNLKMLPRIARQLDSNAATIKFSSAINCGTIYKVVGQLEARSGSGICRNELSEEASCWNQTCWTEATEGVMKVLEKKSLAQPMFLLFFAQEFLRTHSKQPRWKGCLRCWCILRIRPHRM